MASGLATAGQFLIGVILAFGGPLAVIFWGGGILRRIDRDELLLVPVFWYISYASGIIFGAGALYSNLDASEVGWRNVFEAGTLWDISPLELLVSRAVPMLLTSGGYTAALEDAPLLYGAIPAGILLAGMLAGFLLSRPRSFLRGPIVALLLVVGIAYLTYTSVVLLAWSLNALNFWVLFIGTWMLQRNRTAPRSA
jgi:hypothetical protein